jgi:AcrB/AcrD/AcrF family
LHWLAFLLFSGWQFRRLHKSISRPIMVQAQMPGASPEVMATSVTAPLERHLSRLANVTEIHLAEHKVVPG